MCLLTVAPKGTDKYSELLFKALRTAANTNKDGMGYTFKRNSNKKVFISKGFESVEGLIKSLKSHRLKDQDELIVHQRIGNKGAKNTNMCHPFVLGDTEEKILQNYSYVDLPVLAHNGTFHKYSKHNSAFSDTYYFVLEMMHRPELLLLMKNDIKFFLELFSMTLGTNKVAFLFPNEDTDHIKFGDFKEEEGYFFSNDSYKDKTLVNRGGSESHLGRTRQYWGGYDEWNDYDWDDEDSRDSPIDKDHSTAIEVWNKHESKQSSIFEYVVAAEEKSEGQKFIESLNDIVVNAGTTTECAKTAIKFRLFMDMWVPEKYTTATQFDAIRFNPTEFNFSDFELRSLLMQDDDNIENDTFYKIINFDMSSKKNEYSEGLHAIQRKFIRPGKSSDIIYIPHYRLPQLFEIKPTIQMMRKYEGYYRLCQELSPSKTMLKKIDNAMDVKNYSEDPTGQCKFKNLINIPPASLSLYQILLTKYLHPNDYNTELNRKSMVLK